MADNNNRPGAVYKDLLPIPVPSDTTATTDPLKEEPAAPTLRDEPTLSHALAMAGDAEPEAVAPPMNGEEATATTAAANKGAAQRAHDAEVVNLGWHEPKQEIVEPLVGGMDNDELWLLVRRFNKQIYHVKQYDRPVPGNLDLNIAEEEEFSPDKLRANVERLYMTVIIGMLGAGKQVARLRSWRETRRTAWFCTAYFVAWIFDCLVPLFAATIVTLIAYPPSRDFLFPPAPIALVDSKTGGVQKPKAGVLGSHDSATGAPENHKGEAVEQEASNFVNGLASVTLSSVAGKHPQADPPAEGGSPQDTTPDPTALAMGVANAKDAAGGDKPTAKHDKTKVPMETAMWSKMRPVMHGLAEVTDTWERFANALSPTPPFPRNTYRFRLAMVVAPLLLMSFFITSYMFVKGITFGAGFGFFGDPVIARGLAWLNHAFPHWQRLLEMRNTLLKGVPTNAQLTLTLLRVGEANKAPLPPPPSASSPPPDAPAAVTDDQLRSTGADPPLNATAAELDAAMAQPDERVAHETAGGDIDAAKAKAHGRRGSRILNFFRGTTKGVVETAIGADKVKAKTGSDRAKDRLGVAERRSEGERKSGPISFKGRCHGRRGAVYITTKATIPCVAFSTEEKKVERQQRAKMDRHRGSSESEGSGSGSGKSTPKDAVHPAWSVPVAEIRELKKIGGYGWKTKLVVGWAMNREVADGLEITDKTGAVWKVTALPLRDELFNRLVAMGGQKWEAW
ncbi:uncharacterized protein BKCO1_2000319 [Diplodia corticola]|uniref:Uncharacterized protein n=1 Tax=Diplodia corticola TaxID=236234 RepID=A0A1J9SHT1_9PEZI|nr:uncharacterized protein BKCO1_2000319 [Diplodia corticola]OJD39935.1 hypothetical protein BKCO1_2000319 [Diplodia corticola]